MDAAPRTSTLPVGVFGKIPKAGDFVRVGLSNEVTRGFEEWLHRGIQYGHEKRGSSWKSTFLAGTVYAFVFRVPLWGETSGLVGGVLSPSQDSVGRAFPLATLAPLDGTVNPCLLPQALGSYLDTAVALVGRAPELTAAELESSLPALVGLEDVAQIGVAYDWWTRTTRLASVWESAFGSDDSALPAYAIYLLLEAARPFQGQAAPSTPLGMRFPLGRGGVESAGFWLDAVCAAMHWRNVTPTFFWTFDGYRGDIVVQLGRTPASSFMELWSPDPRNDAMTTLVGARPWGDSLARLPPAVRLCFERPHATVADLLVALGT